MALAPVPSCCPIRRVAVHLLTGAGELVRILWLTADGEFSCQPHCLPRDLALVLASNQRLIMGSSAQVRVV